MNSGDFSNYLIDTSLEKVFVVDKYGHTIFFPRGPNGKGYIIKDRKLQREYTKFFSISLRVYFVTTFLLIAAFHSFEIIIFILIVCTAGYVLVNRIYTNDIVKSLHPARLSYKEIILENISNNESEDNDDNDQPPPEIHHPLQKDYAPPLLKRDLLLDLKRFLYRIPGVGYGYISIFFGFMIMLVWTTIHPEKYSGKPEEDLPLFFMLFFWGLGGFIILTRGEIQETGRWAVLEWKLFFGILMIASWAGALYSLYTCFIDLQHLIPAAH